MPSSVKEKLLGCLVGGAIGDCLGGPYENARNVAFDETNTWRLSDDTQLTLATCQSIIKTRRPDPEHIAKTMASWFRLGRIDGIGAATLKALTEINAGGHWALVGRKGEYAAGNGAAMRIAPLAFLIDDIDDSSRLLISDICRITHHNDEAYLGALAIVRAIRLVLDHHCLDMSQVVSFLPDCLVRDRLDAISTYINEHPKKRLSEVSRHFGNTGYVVNSTTLAIATAARMIETKDFMSPMIDVIQGGGDTDTIASMAGQIAGTHFGYDGLPIERVAKVPDLKQIRSVCGTLAKLLV